MGQVLCPALDALLAWAERRDDFSAGGPSRFTGNR
jgi:hypothetical protein